MKRKYGNKKVVSDDGYNFDSKAEASRWGELRLMERAGEISDLQPPGALRAVPGKVRMGASAQRMKPAMKLIVGFSVPATG